MAGLKLLCRRDWPPVRSHLLATVSQVLRWRARSDASGWLSRMLVPTSHIAGSLQTHSLVTSYLGFTVICGGGKWLVVLLGPQRTRAGTSKCFSSLHNHRPRGFCRRWLHVSRTCSETCHQVEELRTRANGGVQLMLIQARGI